VGVPISRLSNGPKHHFFGYYGVNPWDRSLKNHLALETDFHDRRPRVGDKATVGLIDRETHEFKPYAVTEAFNLQQGSMMHWIDAGHGEEFTFNDWEGDRLVSRAVSPETGKVRTIEGAIAAVSPVEPVGVGLNFARMAHCRPVVGYANDIDPATLEIAPEDDGLFSLDFRTGESKLLLSIAEVVKEAPPPESHGIAWFNHVYFNTAGTRILFVSRTPKAPSTTDGHGFYVSVWSVDPDGSDLRLQIGWDYATSHFAWRDERRVMIWANVLGSAGFVEYTDGLGDFAPVGAGVLTTDGHNSFSPDRRWVICDTYPQGPERLQELMLYDVSAQRKHHLGYFHADAIFTGDIRCDLHPRCSPDVRTISFDSVHEGHRQIYLADVSAIVSDSPAS